MAITKPKSKPNAAVNSPAVTSAAADKFISGAPDAPKTVKGVWKGKKRQISITLAPEVLDRVDGLSKKLGQSRAAVIGMAVYRAVEHGLLKD